MVLGRISGSAFEGFGAHPTEEAGEVGRAREKTRGQRAVDISERREAGPARRLGVLGDAVGVLAVLGDREGDPLAGRLGEDAAAELGAHTGIGTQHGRGAGEDADELGDRAAGGLDGLDERSALVGCGQLIVDLESANCGFYGTQDGSIRQVQAAECTRSMTEDRARELEKAMNFD